MRCNDFELIEEKNGKKYIVANIYAASAPGSFPVDGENVDGLSKDHVFLASSTIYVVGNGDLYMLSPNGSWVKQ